jgi:hypothetical protein
LISDLTVRLQGVIPPLVTPFRPDGTLDLQAFEANLESYAGSDLGGYLVLGSNGEAGSLEEDEKLVLVRVARACAGRRPLLAGTGLESTRGTIAFTRKAADAGADGALVLTPHFYRSQMNGDALVRHFEAVAEAAPIPVFLYSVPQFTGLSFPAAVAATLARHSNVAGIKESSGDVGLLSRLLSGAPPGFQVVCGSAPIFYPARPRASWRSPAVPRAPPPPCTAPSPPGTTSAPACCRKPCSPWPPPSQPLTASPASKPPWTWQAFAAAPFERPSCRFPRPPSPTSAPCSTRPSPPSSLSRPAASPRSPYPVRHTKPSTEDLMPRATLPCARSAIRTVPAHLLPRIPYPDTQTSH